MTTAPLDHQNLDLFGAADQATLPATAESGLEHLYGEHSKPWKAIPLDQCQALMVYALRGRKEKLKQLQADPSPARSAARRDRLPVSPLAH